jgi:hypothetical protein
LAEAVAACDAQLHFGAQILFEYRTLRNPDQVIGPACLSARSRRNDNDWKLRIALSNQALLERQKGIFGLKFFLDISAACGDLD